MGEIVVSSLKVQSEANGFRLTHKLSGFADSDVLEYLVETKDHEITPVSNSDHALIALIYPAMLSKRALHFEGVVSEELLFKIRHDVMPLLAARDHRLTPVEITAAKTESAVPAAEGVGTGYSGGVDSYATLELYSEKHAPAAHRISHLILFENLSKTAAGVDVNLAQRAKEYSEISKLPLTFISSNIECFVAEVEDLNKPVLYIQSHSLRSAASAHLLATNLRRYVFSSGPDYRMVSTGPSEDVAYVDAILMPLLSTSTFEMVSGGSGMTRVEKTLMVAENSDAQKYLHVCVRRSGALNDSNTARGSAEFINCSVCWKCARTVATLEAAGKLDRFSEVFDLQYVDQNRQAILGRLRRKLRKGDRFSEDIMAYLAAKGGVEGFLERRLFPVKSPKAA